MTLIRGSNPVWSYVDLKGRQFDDTYFMFVLENQIPYIPATVYHDPNGMIAWTNPIQFFANGTLPIDIYWDPAVIYRLEFRRGISQQAPLIYLVENYVPGSGGGTPPSDISFTTDNQITNPQFARFNLGAVNTPFVLTNVSTQSIHIAPGWWLDLTGTGNVTLTQVPLNSTAANPSNAPYALQIQLSGTWMSATLRQRFYQNGMLWATFNPIINYVACSLTALISGSPQAISGVLVDSLGNTIAQVLNSVSLTGAFTEYMDFGQCATTLNTDTPPSAYIDFRLTLPVNVNMTITSIQLIASNVSTTFPFDQDSIQRQIDHTYHYDYPIVPIGTILDYYGFNLPPHYLPCNNSSYSRQTYSQLFNALTNVETVTLTLGLATFAVANGGIYAQFHPLEGVGIQAGAAISSISGNVVTMSAVATASGPQAIRFFSTGNGDGSTTFNTPLLTDYVSAGAGGTLLPTAGVGSIGGATTVTLVANNLPAHVHIPLSPGANFVEGISSGGGAALTGGSTIVSASSTGINVTTNTPISVIQPTKLANKIIRYE